MLLSSCLHRCIQNLEELKLETTDQQLGVDIVRKALRTPLSTIAKNAGADPSIVVQKVIDSDNPSEGYDALKDRYVDMIHEGTAICIIYHIAGKFGRELIWRFGGLYYNRQIKICQNFLLICCGDPVPYRQI